MLKRGRARMELTSIMLYFFLFISKGVASLELMSTPKYFQGRPMSEFNLTCKTKSTPKQPIVSCQFRIWYTGVQQDGVVLNITNNTAPFSTKNPFASDGSNFTATSFATDLKHGQCGVRLQNLAGGQLIAGCKLTTESNDTAVKTIPLFFIRDKLKLDLDLDGYSEEKRVKLGEDASFKLQTKDRNVKLRKCTMKMNGEYVDIYATNNSTAKKPITLKGRYKGWLENGECGFTIPNVAESDDRTSFIVAENGTSSSAKAISIILENDIQMTFIKKVEDYVVGDVLSATCTTRVHPQQGLVWTWELWERGFVRTEVSNDVWLWPWETKVISDTKNIRLKEKDWNKNISCWLGPQHGDKKNARTASMKLSFKKPPPTPGESQKPFQSLSSPQFVTIENAKTRTVICKADPGVKLTDCGFKLDTKGVENYFNASSGSMTVGQAKLGPFTVVRYKEGELENGTCAIELTAPDYYIRDPLLLGCRARTENSGWKYNYTYIVDNSAVPSKITLQTVPRLPYLLPESNLTVKCDFFDGTSIRNCNFTLPGQKWFHIDKNYKPSPPHNYMYVGEGLARGYCGIFIPNVDTLDTTNDNTIMCEIQSGRTYPSRQMRVVVAAPPTGKPEIFATPKDFKPNSPVIFKCVTPASRPPASITWYFGDEPVSADRIIEEPVGEWRWWRDLETTTQYITLNLTESDEEKNVKCEMNHMALTESRSSTFEIGFKFTTVASTTLTSPVTTSGTGNAPSGNKGKQSQIMPTEHKPSTPDKALYTSIVFAVTVTILFVITVVFEILQY